MWIAASLLMRDGSTGYSCSCSYNGTLDALVGIGMHDPVVSLSAHSALAADRLGGCVHH